METEQTEQTPPLTDAEIAALKKFYVIDIQAHAAGCSLRELMEDIRIVQAEIREEERRRAVLADPASHPRRTTMEPPGTLFAPQQVARAERRIAIHRVRLSMLESLMPSMKDRTDSLRLTCDSIRKHLADIGILDQEQIRYGG